MSPNPEPTQVTVSVVMPVFNEARSVGAVIDRVLQEVAYDLQLVIVDDGSNDGTAAIVDGYAAKDSRIQVLHKPNGGKTSALIAAFPLTRGKVVIIQDADLEYDPAEIVHVIQPILDGYADVVYGSRFMVRRAARVLYFYHFLANELLTFLSNLWTNLNMTDVETGYKAFRGDIIRNMIIESTGFGVEIEVTAKISKIDAVIYEVPISYYGRTYQEGKKIGMTDGLIALWYIIRFNAFCSLKQSYRTIPERRVAHGHDFMKRRS
jgi:glycosyltransferase involved in cell wall biosynthesis